MSYSANSLFSSISLVSHADWSKNPAKHWHSVSVLQPDLHWLLLPASKVGDLSDFFLRIQSKKVIPGCILSGFDFPIGLPSKFAAKVSEVNFLSVLPMLNNGKWQDFFSPAKSPEEISIFRPFYPDKPGHSSRNQLEKGLGICFSDLYRLCELRQNSRRSACPLFWTMGGQQVGKASISGWHDLFIPTLSQSDLKIKIWPFSGPLEDCCQHSNIVVVETYPAEFYTHLGLSFSSSSHKSKRRQSDRLSVAGQLIEWAEGQGIELDGELVDEISTGFGDRPDGEDRFDAVVGLYGMINIILGNRTFYDPTLPEIRNVQGWIFGQAP